MASEQPPLFLVPLVFGVLTMAMIAGNIATHLQVLAGECAAPPKDPPISPVPPRLAYST